MIYTNALIGLAAVLGRTVFIVLGLVHFFPRIDYTLLPGPTPELYSYDSGFAAYAAPAATTWTTSSRRAFRGSTSLLAS